MPLDEVRAPAPEPPNRASRAAAPEPPSPRDAELDAVVEQVVSEERAIFAEHGRGEIRAGLALSGGGVRSATISLGFLMELSRYGVIDQLDYLSSVSGGGYASGYFFGSISAMSPEARRSPKERHRELFGPKAVAQLREAGHYLNRGTGLEGRFNLLCLLAATLNAAILNAIWLVALFATVASFIWWGCSPWLHDLPARESAKWGPLLYVLVLAPLARLLVLSWQRSGRLAYWASKLVNGLEGAVLIAGAIGLVGWLWLSLEPIFTVWLAGSVKDLLADSLGVNLYDLVGERGAVALSCLLLSVLLCFILTPSAIGLHGVFRERIEDAYFKIRPKRRWQRAVMLHELLERLRDGLPYPLFNGCVYLRDADERLPGAQAVDYFLLSPASCGSRLTGYGSTRKVYPEMSVAEAVTTSAASVTPSMDGTSNAITSAVLWGLNLNLGAWLQNPSMPKSRLPIAWTMRYLRVLLGKLRHDARLVHVADGGFIDNLGVFELLRRRCPLIIAVDNTYDPSYEFKHLRSLVTRARSELGVRMTFRHPPEAIRPSAGLGFAARQLVVADLDTTKGAPVAWRGVLVYVKACVLAPSELDRQRRDQSYRYKTWHPKFPQESTADQFFDEDQWNAYFTLGRHMASEVLGTPRSADVDIVDQRVELTTLRERFAPAAAPEAAYI